jgi:hypothetical protein
MNAPSLRTRQILLALAILGLILACAGMIVLIGNNFTLGRILLIGASLILTPMFAYVISMRGRARRSARDRAIARKAELDAQMAAFVTPEGIRATADQPDPARPPAPAQETESTPHEH